MGRLVSWRMFAGLPRKAPLQGTRRRLPGPLGHEARRVRPPGLRVVVQGEDVHDDGRPARDAPPVAQEEALVERHALEGRRRREQAQGLLKGPPEYGGRGTAGQGS